MKNWTKLKIGQKLKIKNWTKNWKKWRRKENIHTWTLLRSMENRSFQCMNVFQRRSFL